ncbi:MAG: response regulator, partial [Candidatus Omnitrophica bacterium]|nr:response regulator [Candidatus Omnitrophota bacterium]
LLVDDEKKIVDLFAAFLMRKGFEVVLASGGEKAIEVLKSGMQIDLMLLDMKMPGVSGLDVLREKAVLKDVTPVIIVTGSFGQEQIYRDLEKLGFTREDIIYKPVDLFLLLEEVKKKLGMKT